MAVATMDEQAPVDGKKSDLMTVDEVLAELNISRATLSRRQAQKLITPVRENPALLKQPIKFRRADVDALKRLGAAVGE